jgi:hypothetical protein
MYVVCPKCGNKWDWYGEGNYATCSKCRHTWKADAKLELKVPNRKVRLMESIELPEGLALDSVEGQRWLLLRIQEIRMSGEKLTATDIKILNDLRDDIKAMREMVYFKELKDTVELLKKGTK